MKAAIKNWFACFLVAAFFFSSLHSAFALQLVTAAGSAFPTKLGGSGDSGLAILSQDGRYVLFASTANNLVPTNNNYYVLPCRFNVYLRDRLHQTTTLVSANLSGTGGGNGDSFPTGISTNGQFALFESSASDLVAHDTNSVSNVYVRDVFDGLTTLVSVTTNGSSVGVSVPGSVRGSVLTPDGRYVAFVCVASNLVAGDTNGIPDVFVRDLKLLTTTRVSLGASPTNYTTLLSASESPEITPDGRYVAFYSTANNLVPKVATPNEIYVRDLVAGQTLWASTNARSVFKTVFGNTNCVSCNYSLSDDGQFLAFAVCSNMAIGVSSRGLILRHSLRTGLDDLISTNASVPLLAFELIHDLSLSPDGRFVAYVANDAGTNEVHLWDAQAGTNVLVSVGLDGISPANGTCDAPVISSNGQFVAFSSSASNLVTNNLASGSHFYLRNLQAGVTLLLDADTNGVGAGVDFSAVPSLSADGSVVVYDCANLLGDNLHLIHDVFAHSVTTGMNELVSSAEPSLLSLTPDAGSELGSSSSNGLFVAFSSEADDLAPGDTNGFRDVFVRDVLGGANILVSVNTNGNSAGDGLSSGPVISGDGRFVAFTSSADNLVPGVTNSAQNVFVRDLTAGATVLVSVSTDNFHAGNGDSFSPSISADGRYVLFHSKASNVAAGSFGSGVENLFFRDLSAGLTYPLTSGGVAASAMTPDGQSVAFFGTPPGGSGTELYVWNSQSQALVYTANPGFGSAAFSAVALSANGQKMAYLTGLTPDYLYVADLAAKTVVQLTPSFQDEVHSSHVGLHFSADGRYLAYAQSVLGTTYQNVYLYDLLVGSNQLVSQNFNTSGAANTNSDSPSISPNGRFIAYRSFATNVVPFDFNGVADLFIYDVLNNTTILVSVNAAGSGAAADRSLKPIFSGDSKTLFFETYAPDISGGDFNNSSDIIELDLTALPLTTGNGAGGTNPPPVLVVELFPCGLFNNRPTLSWPLAGGRSYQVEFKTNLTDAVWQALPAALSFTGPNGYASDPKPLTGQRFYRVISNP